MENENIENKGGSKINFFLWNGLPFKEMWQPEFLSIATQTDGKKILLVKVDDSDLCKEFLNQLLTEPEKSNGHMFDYLAYFEIFIETKDYYLVIPSVSQEHKNDDSDGMDVLVCDKDDNPIFGCFIEPNSQQ